MRQGEDEPTWVVTAGAEEDLAATAALVGEEALADRYAVASGPGGEPLPVPAGDDAVPIEEAGCR